MLANNFLLLGLAAMATASPVTPVVTENVGVSSTVSSSWGPSVTTTLTALACTPTQDPDLGINGCTCSGNINVPYATAGPNACPTEWPTTLPGQYFTTYPNNAVVQFETATQTSWDDTVASTVASSLVGSGTSTTLQAGTSLKVELNPTAYANIGDGTNPSVRSSLYTAITSALSTACPTPVSGSTVTACSPVPAPTGITYMWQGLDFHNDGTLELDIGTVSIEDMTGYSSLIDAIGQAVLNSAEVSGNSGQVLYPPVGVEGDLAEWVYATFTNIPAYIESYLTIDSNYTNGQVLSQNLGVKFVSHQSQSKYSCSIGNEILSGLAAVGNLVGIVGAVKWVDEEASDAAKAAQEIKLGTTAAKGATTGNEFGSVERFGLSVECGQGGGW